VVLDLVPIWTVILAFGVFMYVLLDGFDLGVGILFPFAPDDRARDLMMASVAPIWDGNETWLVLGGLALFAAFPLAFAIILPALYFPILAMVLGLIFRGVAFEFRPGTRMTSKPWDHAFFWGSLIATFAQGCVLGKFVLGFEVNGRQYAGTSWDWVHPFVLAVGVGLVFGYLLLGATWLVMKTEDALQDWARTKARVGLFGTLAFIGMVSLWTPFLDTRIAARWFSWPNIAFLAPVIGMLFLLPIILMYTGWSYWVFRGAGHRRLAVDAALQPLHLAPKIVRRLPQPGCIGLDLCL
jgi:cytochrome d ubiquinol oxidase subunit II